MRIGIDFGTSFSLPAISYYDSNIVLLPGGKYGIPSVFYYDDWEGVLVGEDAENAGQGEEAKNLKREIKLELFSSFVADGKSFSGQQIVGYILSNVKETALMVAKEKLINESLEGVVISVPARFEHNEKDIIKKAAEIPTSQGGPGMKVLGFIKEPVAAALAYYKTSLKDGTRILVYDLGGGTCDVAIVEANSKSNERYRVVDANMKRIGGKDWDSKLEEYIRKEIENQSGLSMANNPGYAEKIKRAAISAKHSFSEKIGDAYRDRVKARVEVNGKTFVIPITKSQFDSLTVSLLNETLYMTKELKERNGDRLIDKIVCVGGSSKMPQVMDGLHRFFPDADIQIYEPEKAIAIGASIYAQLCDNKSVISDIAAFSYGVGTNTHFGFDDNREIVENIVKIGARLPAIRTKSFVPVRAGQKKVVFVVYESEIDSETYDFYNPEKRTIGMVALELPPNAPKSLDMKVTITLNQDGMLEVEAKEPSGKRVKATFEVVNQ